MKKQQKYVEVSVTEMYYMAAEEVMENMPFENKDFNPKDKDECVDMLIDLVEKKKLSRDWIESVASANISNVHTSITLDNKWRWNYLGGLSKSKYSRKDFIKHLEKVKKSIDEGKIKINHKNGKLAKVNKKSPFGKRYFDSTKKDKNEKRK